MRTPDRRFEIRSTRVRAKIKSCSDRLRLCVFKSARHIYAQIIDDKSSRTLVSASSLEKNVYAKNKSCSNIATAQSVGKSIGQKARDLNISSVVFDRGGYKFHGVIKALADSAREYLNF